MKTRRPLTKLTTVAAASAFALSLAACEVEDNGTLDDGGLDDGVEDFDE